MATPIGRTGTGFRVLILAVVAAGLWALPAGAADYYVDLNYAGTETGSETQPFNTIREGVAQANAAAGADTLYVAAGTYNDAIEQWSVNGHVTLTNDLLTVMGGYGGVGDWGSRTPRATILDLAGAGTRAFYGTGGDKMWFDGLTFQNASHAGDGGAILKDGLGNPWSAQVTINDCAFLNNSGGNGGAVYADARAKCYLTHCDFSHNSGTGHGGALYVYAYDGTRGVVDCTFSTNTAAGGEGGALFLYPYQAISGAARGLYPVRRTTFIGNSALRGGAACGGAEGAALYECVMRGNSCTDKGAALYGDGDFIWGEVQNCLIYGNTGGYALYGLTRHDRDVFDLKHCTIADNPGGGVYITDNGQWWFAGGVVITNSIVANNGAYGVYFHDGVTTDSRNISYIRMAYNDVYGHGTADYGGLAATNAAGLLYSFSTYPHDPSLAADPRFANAAGGDYHLSGGPCLDFGTDLGITNDLEGTLRVGLDLGCYEGAPLPEGTLILLE